MTLDRPMPRLTRLSGVCAGLAALLLAAAPAAAQQGGGQQQGQMQQEAQQLRQEIQQINQQLRQVQQQALQDSALQARQLELQEMIGAAARDEDPEYSEKEDRLNEIQREMQQAQQEQDTTQLRSLMMEGQQLRQDVNQTQQQIIQRDSIQQQIETFQDRMEQKMIEIDPEAEQLLERRDSLVSEFRQATGQGQGGQQPSGDDGGGR